MNNATFVNFDTKPFTGYWNGKPKTFKPGERFYTQAWLAEHFAKHLTNRYLIEHGGEVYASPKNPGQVQQFMDVFKKAFIPDTKPVDLDELDVAPEPSMDIDVKKPTMIDQGPAAALAAEVEASLPQGEAQIINPPADDEESFDHGANA
jgi:hypothetical protein